MNDPDEEFRPTEVDRALTTQEKELAIWMLNHGKDEATRFLPHLENARVISECGCGCGSIDFSINGGPKQVGGLGVVAEFQFGEGVNECLVFIFQKNGLLAGIEFVWMYDEADIRLPKVEELVPTQDF